jgi:hypothetical protein
VDGVVTSVDRGPVAREAGIHPDSQIRAFSPKGLSWMMFRIVLIRIVPLFAVPSLSLSLSRLWPGYFSLMAETEFGDYPKM